MVDLIGVLIAASLGVAQTGTAATAPEGAPAANPDPMICKKSKEPIVGTRLKPKPVCMSKSDWELDTKVSKRGVQKLIERTTSPTPIPSAR